MSGWSCSRVLESDKFCPLRKSKVRRPLSPAGRAGKARARPGRPAGRTVAIEGPRRPGRGCFPGRPPVDGHCRGRGH
eukprot:765169-Hanusia_phi.AAC.2